MPNPFSAIKVFKIWLLHVISAITIRYYKSISLISIVLSIIGLIYSGLYLEIDADQDNLISNNKAYHQKYKAYLEEFGDLEDLVVVIETKNHDPSKVRKIIDDIVLFSKNSPDLFYKIQYKIDLGLLESESLLLLDDEDFNKVFNLIKNNQDDLTNFYHYHHYSDFFTDIGNKFELLNSNSNPSEIKPLFHFIEEVLQNFDDPKKINNIELANFFTNIFNDQKYIDPQGYLFSPDGSLAFILISPQKNYHTTKIVEKPLLSLREKINSIKNKNPELTIGVTGRPALQHDELKSTGQDSVWTGLGAFIGVSLLFIYFFNFHRGPVIAIVSLVCGLSWSIGWITLTLGHLNLLTTVFTVILIGLGIDYGIHFLFYYQRKKASGKNQKESIEMTIHQAGGAIITGAISSSVAFLSAIFTDFLGLQELGFVAGSGLIFCLIAQIITLPSLLLLAENKNDFHTPKTLYTNWYQRHFLSRPKRKIAVILLITVFFLPYFKAISFEDNLLKLQDPHAESVIFEKMIINNPEISSWTGVHLRKNLDELKSLNQRLHSLKSVKKTESILDFLPQSEERIEKLKSLNISLDEKTFSQEKNDLASSLNFLKSKLDHLIEVAFLGGRLDALPKLESLSSIVNDKIQLIRNKNQIKDQNILESEKIFFSKTKTFISNLHEKLSPQGITIDKIPEQIKNKFIGKNGSYVSYSYPSENIWDGDNLEHFIHDLRYIDPETTGSPIQTYESTRKMKNGFFLVGLITLIIVLIILWIDLGNLVDCIIAMVPLLIGLLWLTLFMGYFDIKLSLGNFFALPLLMGIGIDNGIHLIHNFREQGCIQELFRGILTPIFLSTLTTILGFGSLSLVSHQGLASFGQIMTLGSMSCFLASFILVPTFLSFKKVKTI